MGAFSVFAADPVTVAQRLLGSFFIHEKPYEGRGFSSDPLTVVARIVEVEAYGSDPAGHWPDPASHAFRGPTPRSAIMSGPPGILYVYRSMGIHSCANVVCGPSGSTGAVLLRAAEIVQGQQVVASRRAAVLNPDQWARGPGNLCQAMSIDVSHNGADLADPVSPIRVQWGPLVPRMQVQQGPRVGVSHAQDFPWRWWIRDSAAVSSYRRVPARSSPATDLSSS